MISLKAEDKEGSIQDSHSDHRNSNNSNNKNNNNSLKEPIEVIGMAISLTRAMPLEVTITPLYPWMLIVEE